MRRIVAAATLMTVVSACSLFQSQGAAQAQGRFVTDSGGPNPVEELGDALGLRGFSSCDDVLSYLQTNALPMVTAWGLGGGPFMFAARDIDGEPPSRRPALEPIRSAVFDDQSSGDRRRRARSRQDRRSHPRCDRAGQAVRCRCCW